MSEYIIEFTDVNYTVEQIEHNGEIVRCGDCAFFADDVSTVDESGSEIVTVNLCEWTDRWVEPDGFCAWGERKEGGDD